MNSVTLPSPLASFAPGRVACIVALDMATTERQRLEAMGLYPGAQVSVLASGWGPLLLSVGESRVMVERDVATQVLAV